MAERLTMYDQDPDKEDWGYPISFLVLVFLVLIFSGDLVRGELDPMATPILFGGWMILFKLFWVPEE
jgi:hypothetical protein